MIRHFLKTVGWPLGTAAGSTALLLAFACGSGGGDDLAFEAGWKVGPGQEKFVCSWDTLEEDTYINAVYPTADLGTHHGLVMIVPDEDHELAAPDGVDPDCFGFEHFGTEMFATVGGRNEDPFMLPDGVATKLEAGTQVFGNFHVYNPTDAELKGTTGVHVDTLEASEVETEAEVLLVGKLTLNIPPMQESTHVGECPIPADATYFGVSVHMHTWATHAKVVLKSSVVGDVVVYDKPWVFESGHSMEPTPEEVPMKQGDTIEVHCTYFNDTDRTLIFEDSADEEMCVAALYQYPANLEGANLCGS